MLTKNIWPQLDEAGLPPRPAAVTAAPSRASASPATLSVQEFNKSGVKAICHGIFEE